MTNRNIAKIITFLIASVWLINGLFCKILGLVPRHEEIVAEILSLDRPSAYFATKAIGILEVAMFLWILSGIKRRFNAVTQIIIVATMNLLEFILVPDLLLWGKWNSIFALVFILVIYYTEFHLRQKITSEN